MRWEEDLYLSTSNKPADMYVWTNKFQAQNMNLEVNKLQVLALNVGACVAQASYAPLIEIKHSSKDIDKLCNVWIQRLCLQLVQTSKCNTLDLQYIIVNTRVDSSWSGNGCRRKVPEVRGTGAISDGALSDLWGVSIR